MAAQEASTRQVSTSSEKHTTDAKYYACNTDKMIPILRSQFLQLNCDEATQSFLDTCYNPSWWYTMANMAASAIGPYMSLTDTNALLSRGQMFCLSTEQFKLLLGPCVSFPLVERMGRPRSGRPVRVLDVGAGDGNVSRQFAPFFDEVIATEASARMCDRLRQRGYTAVNTCEVTHESLGELAKDPFDVVMLLNVLDRCDKPVALLKQLRAQMAPDGVLVVAVVLPFCAFVETANGRKQKAPSEPLDIPNGCNCRGGVRMPFEECVNHMVERVFIPCGFDVLRFSHVPYLSQGDSAQPIYILEDGVFVLGKTPDPPPGARPAPLPTSVASETGGGYRGFENGLLHKDV